MKADEVDSQFVRTWRLDQVKSGGLPTVNLLYYMSRYET